MKRPKITIRMGAAHNSITVDKNTIEINGLTKGQFRMARGIIVGALKEVMK